MSLSLNYGHGLQNAANIAGMHVRRRLRRVVSLRKKRSKGGCRASLFSGFARMGNRDGIESETAVSLPRNCSLFRLTPAFRIHFLAISTVIPVKKLSLYYGRVLSSPARRSKNSVPLPR